MPEFFFEIERADTKKVTVSQEVYEILRRESFERKEKIQDLARNVFCMYDLTEEGVKKYFAERK